MDKIAVAAIEVNGSRCCIGPCMIDAVVHLRGKGKTLVSFVDFLKYSTLACNDLKANRHELKPT